MKTFLYFFKFELKRFWSLRNSILVFTIFALALVFIQVGVNEYRDTLDRTKQFQQLEKAKVSKYINYRIYGVYGYRTIFLPSPFSIMFRDSGVITDMVSFVDSGERLKIYLPLIGSNIFELKKSGYSDFAGIIFYFGTLLALFYGFDTFKSREYLKFLSSLRSPATIFWVLTVVRGLILLFLFVILVLVALGLTALNGFYIQLNFYIVAFLIPMAGLVLFFFAMGCAFGTARSRKTALSTLLAMWLILLFVLPEAIHTYVRSNAKHIKKVYQLEMEKFDIFSSFEKRAMKNNITYKYGEKLTKEVKNTINKYWKNEFRQIQILDRKMHEQMNKSFSIHYRLTVLFPTTYYLSVNNEISSSGFLNLLDFYSNVRNKKREFVRFFFDKLYFSNFSKVESFIKNDENIFYAKSNLPPMFLWGILLISIYISIMCFISYSRFRKRLFELPTCGDGETGFPELQMKPADLKIYMVSGSLFSCQLYRYFMNTISKKSLKSKGRIVQDADFNKMTPGGKKDFLYLCHPDVIPGDIDADDLTVLTARLSGVPVGDARKILNEAFTGISTNRPVRRLESIDKGKLILALLRIKKRDIYLIDDVTRGLPCTVDIMLKEKMEQLKTAGSLVVFLTTDDIMQKKPMDSGKHFYETASWSNVVNSMSRHESVKTGKNDK
jgi:ABC-type transport system involved in cytochrome c biogenesis ATPase subunit